MARSLHVYVLTQYGQVFGTYTVKHELQRDVRHNLSPHVWTEYRVSRYRDGGYAEDYSTFNLKEFME